MVEPVALSLWRKSRKATFKAVSQGQPRVIAFWSPVSSGKTTLSAALAASLAASGTRTVAVDLDFQTPTLPWSDFGLDQVVEDFLTGNFSGTGLVKRLPKTSVNRLWVLGGAEDILRTELLGRQEITKLLDELANHFDAVVIDTSRTLQFEPVLAALDRAEVVYVPVRTHGQDLRHVVRYLNLLQNDLQYPAERLKVVLNDVRPGDLDKRDVERAIGRPIDAVVPRNRAWLDWDGNGWPSAMPAAVFASFMSAAAVPGADSAVEEGGMADAAGS